MNIILIGYRSSGKSTVGKMLANLLEREFVDIDETIEKRHKKSISDIVKSHGWDYFRMIERDVIKEVSKRDNLVIAPGGGAVLNSDNVRALKKKGFMIWLVADCETIRKRMEADKRTKKLRPPLTDKGTTEELEEIIALRIPFYKSVSDAEVETSNLDVNEVVKEIISLLKDRMGRI